MTEIRELSLAGIAQSVSIFMKDGDGVLSPEQVTKKMEFLDHAREIREICSILG